MKPFGAFILAASSWACWSLLSVLGVVLWQRNRVRDTGNGEPESIG
jgi:hypothetical protein